jgi:hypothetical protein
MSKGSRWLMFVALIPCGVLAGACGARRVREDARLMSLYTQRVQKEAEQFAAHRDQVAKARTRNIGFLEASALAGEQRVATQLLVWRIAGPEQLTMFQTILEGTTLAARQRQEALERREAHEKAVEAARSGVEVRQGKLAETSQTLAQLAESPSLKEESDFYVGFFTDVRKRLDDAQKAAGRQAEKATEAAAAKAPGTASPQPKQP